MTCILNDYHVVTSLFLLIFIDIISANWYDLIALNYIAPWCVYNTVHISIQNFLSASYLSCMY